MSYAVQLEADDGQGELAWALDQGQLPEGLELDSSGAIQGQPSASGSYAFSVLVQDDLGEDSMDMEILVPDVVLMSGFEPFGSYETNPSIDALLPLHEELLVGLDIRVVELPVVWDDGWYALEAEILRLDPIVVIATGQAGTDAMRFETLAVNEQYGTDNDGEYRGGAEVVKGGPEELADSLPIDEMSAAMEAGGYATTVSDSAGSYLCNDVFYHLMYHAEQQDQDGSLRAAGFIHVSPASENDDYSVDDISAAHRLGLEALASWLDSGAALSAVLAETVTPPVYFP